VSRKARPRLRARVSRNSAVSPEAALLPMDAAWRWRSPRRTAERQLHEAEGVAEPGHGPVETADGVVNSRGQDGGHDDVDLDRSVANNARPHEVQDVAQPGMIEAKQSGSGVFAQQTGNLPESWRARR